MRSSRYRAGYGTLDEVFEVATLVQTGKIHEFPVALLGVEYWDPLLKFLRETLQKVGTIDPPDVDRVIVSDTPAEVVARIAEAVVPRFNLRFERAPRRRWWLFEWPARRGCTNAGAAGAAHVRERHPPRATPLVSGVFRRG